jgi:hypothetical protein
MAERTTLLVAVCAGHVPQILGPKNAWVFSNWANTYGPLYKLHVLEHFMLVLTDPASITQLTRKGGEALQSGPNSRHRDTIMTVEGSSSIAVGGPVDN